MSEVQTNGHAAVNTPLLPSKDVETLSEEAQLRSDRISLLRKLSKVMRDVDYIQKDKKNEFHKYWYASEAAIKAHVQKSLVEHGLVFYTDVAELTERPVGTKGDTLTTLRVIYHFADIDTGAEISGCGVGSGADGGDKGVYKSITGAIKYILSSTFLFATGDDPEEAPAQAEPVKPAAVAARKAAPAAASAPSPKPPASAVTSQPTAAPVAMDVVIDQVSAETAADKCQVCGKGIGDATVNGKTYTGAQILMNARNKFKKDLCMVCHANEAAALKQSAGRVVNSSVQ